jgi:hypothetical protein
MVLCTQFYIGVGATIVLCTQISTIYLNSRKIKQFTLCPYQFHTIDWLPAVLTHAYLDTELLP